MELGQQITEVEADKLIAEGVAQLFDLPSCACGGFFKAEPGTKHLDIILVITDDGYFIRAKEDLVKSEDEVFVGFVEDGEDLPNFDDVFTIIKPSQ